MGFFKNWQDNRAAAKADRLSQTEVARQRIEQDVQRAIAEVKENTLRQFHSRRSAHTMETINSFAKSSRPSLAESRTQYTKEKCADLRQALSKFEFISDEPFEVDLAADIIAFIQPGDNNPSAAPAPAPSRK